MPRYFARVELHKATEDDYETLHDLLKVKGFTQCHKTAEGMRQLPTGFYVANKTEESVDVVAKSVKASADSVKSKNEIVVVKSQVSKSFLSTACK
jgi:hypothetical protein